MKSTHILDCTQIELPPWWPKFGIKMLPVVKGEHGLDWDVVEEELPSQFVKELRSLISKRDNLRYANGAKKLPVGFQSKWVPKGAVIRARQ